jgi:hypothetical protein
MIVSGNRQIPTPEDFETGPAPETCKTCSRWRLVLLAASDDSATIDQVCCGCWKTTCDCTPLTSAYEIKPLEAAA